VLDGLKDKRKKGKFYAVTPDRTILFLTMSIDRSLQNYDIKSDAIRAYLNAPSIDKNIVVVLSKEVSETYEELLLLKGLYGSKSGALSWEVWCDDILIDSLQFHKCDVARGVYMKKNDGEITRVLRHSDDFKFSGNIREMVMKEYEMLATKMRVSDPEPVDRFLGCTFQVINDVHGYNDVNGKLVLVRQIEKINEMEIQFQHLFSIYNPKRKIRKTPAPLNNIQHDDDLDEIKKAKLDERQIQIYQSIAGCLNWITTSTRYDAYFAYWCCSRNIVNPREWDMYCIVWAMEYIIHTKETPLVLGGSIVDPEVLCDASFATLSQSRSVMGHFARMGPKSGAIFANISATKNAVKSIFEAELSCVSNGSDTMVYVTNVIEELEYKCAHTKKIYTDSETTIRWIHGSVPTRASKHMDVRLYDLRHREEDGDISVNFISTNENIADILTKSLPYDKHRKFASKILGHDLIKGFGILGYLEYDE
jgi:hypothetical protein